MKINHKKHLVTQLIVACVLVGVGIFLLIAGFFIAPAGVIAESILVAFGEISSFAGALFGIDYTYKHKQQMSND